VIPGAETCPQDAQVVVPGPGVRLARAAPAAARRSIAVPTALRQAAAGASGGRYAQARSGAQKARGPRPAMVPGAAAPPPQQASGRWHRRAGPASRWPGGTCPGFGPDRPLADRATPGSRAPGGRCPAPKPREGTLMPAMRPLRRPGGHRRQLSRKVRRAPGSRPPGPLRLAATCRQDAPPGRRPPARSPVGGHQGAAHWVTKMGRRSSHSVSGFSCRRGVRPPPNADYVAPSCTWFESEETRRLASSALIELLNDLRGCLNRVQTDPPSGCNAFVTGVVCVPKGAHRARVGR